MGSHEVHQYILERMEFALGSRSWAWLARRAGIPQSTLATQERIPKFSIATLLAVSDALARPVTFFLPGPEEPDDDAQGALTEIEEVVRRFREEASEER